MRHHLHLLGFSYIDTFGPYSQNETRLCMISTPTIASGLVHLVGAQLLCDSYCKGEVPLQKTEDVRAAEETAECQVCYPQSLHQSSFRGY